MTYRVDIDRKALRFIEKAAPQLRRRLLDGLTRLADDPRHGEPHKGALRGRWKLRVGDYRVIYRVSDEQRLVEVLMIGHRREIYRG